VRTPSRSRRHPSRPPAGGAVVRALLGWASAALLLLGGGVAAAISPLGAARAAALPCTVTVGSGSALASALRTADGTAATEIVCLRPGTFRANLDVSRTAAITLRGRGVGVTVLRPQNTNSILSIGLGAHVTVAALTITGGLSGDPGGLVGTGAGIHTVGTLTLDRVAVTGNGCAETPAPGRPAAGSVGSCRITTTKHHTINAGGIYNTGRLTLIASSVDDNSAFQGSGIMNNHGGLTRIESGSRVDGNGGPGSSDGAGLYNHHGATMVLSHATVSGNRTEFLDSSGGGIFNQAIGSARGHLTLDDSVVADNRVDHIGGGILNRGDLSMVGTTVAGNIAGNNGGGIINVGAMTISRSRFVGNAAGDAASPYGGGAIYNAPGSTMSLTASAVTGNEAHYGAGIDDEGGRATITSSTLDGNGCLIPCADPAGFGAVYNAVGALVTLTGSTIAGNLALHAGLFDNFGAVVRVQGGAITGNHGGGIYNQGHPGDPARLTVADALISANTGAGGLLNYGAATLDGVTVTANTSLSGGGGIDNLGSLSLTGTTLSGNRAATVGGGLLNNGGTVVIGSGNRATDNLPNDCTGLATCSLLA